MASHRSDRRCQHPRDASACVRWSNVGIHQAGAPVNEYWTVAGVLGIAYLVHPRPGPRREVRVRGEPWAPDDAEPDGDWLNFTDSSIESTLPRAAAESPCGWPSRPTPASRSCRLTGCIRTTLTALSTPTAVSIAASTWTRSMPRSIPQLTRVVGDRRLEDLQGLRRRERPAAQPTGDVGRA